MRTAVRNVTGLAIAALLIVIAVSMNSPGPDTDVDDNRWRNLSLEIAMADGTRSQVNVAIAASLGSAGNYAQRSQRIRSESHYPRRAQWSHKFKAKVGEVLTAEVAVPDSVGVNDLRCFFYQEGYGDPKLEGGHGAQLGAHKGYGDITNYGSEYGGQSPMTLTRCKAVVKP